MSESPAWITEALQEIQAGGLLRRRRVVSNRMNGWCDFDGQRLLDFASNDYLNLASDARVVDAAIEALRHSGVGARASALVCGRTEWHERLEQRLAAFEGQPEAVLFPTGMAANIGTVAALCGPEDLILCDRANHASLVDGCRLSKAKLRVYRHDDLSAVEREFKKGESARRRWIITDSVFSMDGDLAPLPDLCDIAERFRAGLIVDEAHGTGVFGTNGRGVCEELGVESRVSVRVGTLSKALGALGGFVAGSQELVDLLWNRARSQIYSTALPPAICAAAIAAVDIIDAEPGRRRRLLTAARLLRSEFRSLGIDPMQDSIGPIVPIILTDPEAAIRVAERLERQGFLVGAIRPPTVPRGTSRLRIVVSAAHKDDDLMRLAKGVAEEIRSER